MKEQKSKKNTKRLLFFLLAIFLSFFIFNLSSTYKKITADNDLVEKYGSNVFSSEKTREINDLTQPIDMVLPPKEENRLDLLVLGIRGKDDLNGGLLSDTIMVLSLDKKTGQTSIISLPRDLYVNIKGIFSGKINEIYEVGVINKNEFNFTKEVFSRISGIHIDNVAVFDFNSFTSIIDSVDGIEVELEEPFEEKLQWGNTFYLPEGENLLDSGDALYYVRSRYGSDDFDRAQRQQKVLLAVKDKALSIGILSNPIKLNSMISVLSESLRTDLKIWDAPNLITLAQSAGASDNPPNQYVFSTQNDLYAIVQDKIYFLLPNLNDYKQIQKAFSDILE